MRIGIVHHGQWSYDAVSNDGYAKILIPFVAELLRNGHEVHIWAVYNFTKKDSSIEKAHISRAIKAVQILTGYEQEKDCHKLFSCQKYQENKSLTKWADRTTNFVINCEEFYHANLSADLFGEKADDPFPELDACLMTMAGNVSCFFPRAAVIYHYAMQGKPCFIWDGDVAAKNGQLYKLMDSARIDVEALKRKVVCLCPTDFLEEHQKAHLNVETLHFPYPEDEVILEDKTLKYDVSYIGNEYDRLEPFKRIYGKITEHNVNVFGNWEEKLWPERIKYYGGIPPKQVRNVLSETLCSIQIVRPSYAALGYQTMRMQEVPAYGAILMADSKIKGLSSRLEKECCVKDGEEANAFIWKMKSLSRYDQHQIILDQRNKAKKYSLEKVVNQFLGYVEKYTDKKTA